MVNLHALFLMEESMLESTRMEKGMVKEQELSLMETSM